MSLTIKSLVNYPLIKFYLQVNWHMAYLKWKKNKKLTSTDTISKWSTKNNHQYWIWFFWTNNLCISCWHLFIFHRKIIHSYFNYCININWTIINANCLMFLVNVTGGYFIPLVIIWGEFIIFFFFKSIFKALHQFIF